MITIGSLAALTVHFLSLLYQEVCYQYWPGSDGSGIDGEAHGEHIIYTLETRRQDRFIVRKLGITGPNVSQQNL